MQLILLILLAMPSLCYAHSPDIAGYAFIAMYGVVAILLFRMLLSLFIKNEKSERSFEIKLVMRVILFLVSIFVLFPLMFTIIMMF
jgi:hypothetical protein